MRAGGDRIIDRSMALEAAEAVLLRRRPFQAAGGGDGEISAGGPPPVFLAAERGRPVDPVVWGDEKRMKRELVAWAKAVASMAAAGKNASRRRRRRRPGI